MTLADTNKEELLITHYLEIGQYEKAMPLLRSALAHDSQNGKLHFQWANLHLQMDRDEEVEEHFQEALRLGYSEVQVYFKLGHYYRKKKWYDEAEEAFRSILRVQPNNASALASTAHLLVLRQQKKEGLQMIDAAMRLAPMNADVWNSYILIQSALGKKRAKQQAIEQRLQMPENEKYRQYLLGWYELDRNRYRAAREHFRQSYLLNPHDRHVQQVLARVSVACNPLFWPLLWLRRIVVNVLYVLIVLLSLSFFIADQTSWAKDLWYVVVAVGGYMWLTLIARSLAIRVILHQLEEHQKEHFHG